MPKLTNLTPIAEEYPDVTDVPATATITISVSGVRDFRATLAQLAAIIGTEGGGSVGLVSFNGSTGPEITFGLSEMVALGVASEDYVDTAVSGATGTDFTTERTLTHLAGFATADAGKQSLTNMIQLGHMAQIATDSFLGRDTASTGNVEVLSAATARSVLDYGSTGKADIGTAFTNLSADATAGIVIGNDVLVALLKKFVDNAATVRATFDTLGVLYSTAALTEGHNIVSSADATGEVEGIPGTNLAAQSSPSAVSSSSGTLTIDWTTGTKFRTWTTTESATIAASGLETFEVARVVVTGGGAHTISWPVGSRVPDGFESGLVVASGEKYILVFQHDGTDLLISISSEMVEVV